MSENRELSGHESLLNLYQASCLFAQKALVLRLSKEIGVENLDGLSLDDYYRTQCAYYLEQQILILGDSEPARAEALQKLISDLKLPPPA